MPINNEEINEKDKNPVGRPMKWRRVAFIPRVDYFKPAGIPLNELEDIPLAVEEAEALRLKDLEGLEQEDCAKEMNVSRPTYQRLLNSARRKVADALLNGKAIRIEGGNFEMAVSRFKCHEGHEWNVPFESMIENPPTSCPVCDYSGYHTGSIRKRRGRGG
jgi:predicted DNA-binding protein (UPF0251 family)